MLHHNDAVYHIETPVDQMPNILMMIGCRIKLIGLQQSKICMAKFSKKFKPFGEKLVEFELGDEIVESNKYYMAPELLAGKTYGRGVDWYAQFLTQSYFHDQYRDI